MRSRHLLHLQSMQTVECGILTAISKINADTSGRSQR